ncbi:MAG TPA: hypothetical protein VF590_13485 [Isosphaeraceae bacterium]
MFRVGAGRRLDFASGRRLGLRPVDAAGGPIRGARRSRPRGADAPGRSTPDVRRDRRRRRAVGGARDPRYGSRPELLEALARLGPDPQAAEAMTGCLGVFGLDAARSLRAPGPAAEPAVLRVAQGAEPPATRAEACRVLGQIGTPRAGRRSSPWPRSPASTRSRGPPPTP